MERKTQEDSTAYRFNEGLTEEKFKEIVLDCANKIKRIQNINVDGLTVYCTVISVTGLTSWKFILDYNDCGELTGECYIKTGNYDSDIPQRLNNLIYEKLKPYIERIEKVKESKRKEKEKEKQQKLRIKKRIISILVVISTLLVFISFGYYEYQRLIPVGYSTSELIGNEYSTVIEKLREKGFINIVKREISDLSISREKEANIVTNVRFGFNEQFNEKYKYPGNLWVVVTYHTVKLYRPPLTLETAKEMNYQEAVNSFKDAGFTNVNSKAKYDIITGWITEDGEIESISINGNKEYDSYDKVRLDAEVIITYHTYKKNKPKWKIEMEA